MKLRRIIIIVLSLIMLTAIGINAYNWATRGNQTISMVLPREALSNNTFSVKIGANNSTGDLEVKKCKVTFLDNNSKVVKNTKVNYEKGIAIVSVPEVESGTYHVKANITTKAGTDEIDKTISISSSAKENVIVTFDKGIYKPGDIVNFRALILNKNTNNPIITNANISIYDGNDNRVYNNDLTTSDYGIVFGSFKLGDEVNSGLYKFILKTEQSEITKQFKVNPYVLPKYEVNITTDKNEYLVNDKVEITAEAKYFFGEPVVGASISFLVDDNPIGIGVTDSKGIATKTFTNTKNQKLYSVKIEAQDTSNYYVEANSMFNVGTDLIKIEILPEYGKLVSNEKNKIYVATKDVYGNPIKTYLDVNVGAFKKQVITDDNGVGTFDIDVGSEGHQTITIRAENMNGDIVTANQLFECRPKDVLIKTDKTKYVQGEEITLKVNSIYDFNTIYVCKGNNILKIFSDANKEQKFDLGDNFGLIDIYVQNKNSRGRYYDYLTNNYKYDSDFLFKKTIFIAPKESLEIAINTDKTEYKPGENIKLSFDITDENNNKKNAALLVSMLDNSILSLAKNDLSIDNIRLALEDIKITEEIDAATLYSAVMNEESEQDLISLLLKQSDKTLNVNSYSYLGYKTKDKYFSNTVTLAIILALFLIICAVLFTNKGRKIVISILNIFVTWLLIVMLLALLFEALDWYSFDELLLLCFGGVVTIMLYKFVIEKKWKNTVTRTNKYSSIIVLLIFAVMFLAEYYSNLWFLVVLLVPIVWQIILTKLVSKGKIKNNKVVSGVKKINLALKDFGTFTLALVIWAFTFGVLYCFLYEIIDDKFYYDVLEWFIVIEYVIGVISYYWAHYYYDKHYTLDKEKTNNNDDDESISSIIAVIFAIVFIVIIASLGVLLFNRATDMATSSSAQLDSISAPSSGYRPSTSGITVSDPAVPKNSISDIFSGLSKRDDNSSNYESDYHEATSPDETNTSSQEDDYIRNVFLESMCFVPELIAEDGKANLDLKLSDNITTWTIQAIGNTKDGRVGYGKIDNVKVFKEFFADFELPKNLVKGDIVSIPVTIYNYTDNTLLVSLNIKEQSWFKLIGNYENEISINKDETKLVYVPIEVLEIGDNTFRVEATSNGNKDIIEKVATIVPKGFKVEKLVTSGVLDRDVEDDIILRENVIDDSAKVKVKIYSNSISQTVEGVESILRMPTGCFEQVSSSLYPDIVALKYLENNKLDNEELRQRALLYISSGYQKLLSYEVRKSGGFSLYGEAPAETVLTAYGLMEFTDLQKVYDVDEHVIKRMTDYIFGRQNGNGTFNVEGYHKTGLDYGHDDLAEAAYITWALSEAVPTDSRLNSSIRYLVDNIENAKDPYTLALIANALVNANDSHKNEVINKLIDMIILDGDKAYYSSSIRDYYGSFGRSQNIQTTALASLALSKNASNQDVNKKLMNYIISNKDCYGTWYSTQSTVLNLKAINEYATKQTIKDQTIKVKLNNDEKTIDIKGNALDVYNITFDNVSKENKLSIDFDEGEALYDVQIEYYKAFEDVDLSQNSISVETEINNNLSVNDILNAEFEIKNNSSIDIVNGMVVINIPQGFVTIEESLNKLVAKGIIEKYETNYRTVNLYIRNFAKGETVKLETQFRASYPVQISGMQVRAYDYYNPDIEGYSLPKEIVVK